MLYGNYRTRTFSEIFPTYNEFKTDFEATPLGNGLIANNELEIIYFLLMAKYKNSHIMGSDEDRFKLNVFSELYAYGPTYVKRMDIQKKLRTLTEGEIMLGTKVIYNHSFNPNTSPSTSTLDELDTINDQNTSNTKRGKIQAYTELYSVLNANLTKEFVNKFRKLFRVVVEPELPLWYITEESDEDDLDE